MCAFPTCDVRLGTSSLSSYKYRGNTLNVAIICKLKG